MLSLPYSKRDPEYILQELKDQLKSISGGRWTDFLESDLGYIIVKSMVQLLDHQAFYTDAQVAECFLSTCMTREATTRIAKMLNYTPTRVATSSVDVNLVFPVFNVEITIPADSVWRINEKLFICEDQIIIPPGQSSQVISLKQGSRYTRTITGNGSKWYKTQVPMNLAEMSLKINGDEWDLTDSFLEPEDEQCYRMYEEKGSFTVLFADGVIAAKPANGDTISISGIITLGSKSIIYDKNISVTPVTIIRNPSNVDITNSFTGYTTSGAFGGADVETMGHIKANAPGFYSSTDRAITKTDYDSLVRRIPGVTSSITIGGEKLNSYGSVFVLVYGDDPFIVSQEFLDYVKAVLLSKKWVLISDTNLHVIGPEVIEIAIAAHIGISTAGGLDQSTAVSRVSAKINEYFDNFQISQDYYSSAATAMAKSVEGIGFVDLGITLNTSAWSESGRISIPLPENAVLTNMQLKKLDGTILFTGDGTSKVTDGYFNHTIQDLADQKLKLFFSTDGFNVIVRPKQVVVLKSISTTQEYVE